MCGKCVVVKYTEVNFTFEFLYSGYQYKLFNKLLIYACERTNVTQNTTSILLRNIQLYLLKWFCAFLSKLIMT